jgi:aryl-alcohol dehydrogenase-like predicted oxidoreductase
MEYRRLGRTGLNVSLAGLGAGGSSRLGLATHRTADESHRVVHRALDLGINCFDTSPAYSSEALLGDALQGIPRDRYVLATKFQPHQGRALLAEPEALMRQLEDSLRYLRVDYVDVLQYHAIAPDEYATVLERYHPLALRAREQGKVRFLGITETVVTDQEHAMLAAALPQGIWDTCMIKYGILNQSAEREAFALAEKHDVGVFIMAAVRTSLRSDEEAVRHIRQFIAEGLLDRPVPSADDPLGLGSVGQGIPSLTRAAYQFATLPAAVSTVLIGTGDAAHLEANVADMFAPPISPEQVAYLKRTFGSLAWYA